MCTRHYVAHFEYVFYWSVELFFTLKDNLGKIKPEMFSGLLIHTVVPHTHAHAHMIVLEYTCTHTHKLEISREKMLGQFPGSKSCASLSESMLSVDTSYDPRNFHKSRIKSLMFNLFT